MSERLTTEQYKEVYPDSNPVEDADKASDMAHASKRNEENAVVYKKISEAGYAKNASRYVGQEYSAVALVEPADGNRQFDKPREFGESKEEMGPEDRIVTKTNMDELTLGTNDRAYGQLLTPDSARKEMRSEWAEADKQAQLAGEKYDSKENS